MTAVAPAGAPYPKDLSDREWLTALAYRAIRFPNMCVDAEVWAVTRLDEVAASEAFSDLIEAIRVRDGFEDQTLEWHDILPDATGYDRDGQAREVALTRVEDALDVLLGGGR